MSERIAEGETGAAVESGHACPECGVVFETKHALGIHRRNDHGVKGREARRLEALGQERPKRPRSQRAAGSAEINRLRRQLKQSTNAIMLMPFMAKGTADRLANPQVTNLIDAKAEAFADAWIAVAEQNEYVRKNLAFLLAGGVWFNAAAQTAALGYVVAVFSGFAPLHPGALMLLPEMGQFVYQPPAGANGAAAPTPPPAPEEPQVGDQGA